MSQQELSLSVDLEGAVGALKKDLLADGGPRISTIRSYNFAILPYPPDQEFKLRAKIHRLSSELTEGGWLVKSIALQKLLFDRLRAEGPDFIETLIATEKRHHAKAVKLSGDPAEPEPEAALRYLASHIGDIIEGPFYPNPSSPPAYKPSPTPDKAKVKDTDTKKKAEPPGRVVIVWHDKASSGSAGYKATAENLEKYEPSTGKPIVGATTYTGPKVPEILGKAEAEKRSIGVVHIVGHYAYGLLIPHVPLFDGDKLPESTRKDTERTADELKPYLKPGAKIVLHGCEQCGGMSDEQLKIFLERIPGVRIFGHKMQSGPGMPGDGCGSHREHHATRRMRGFGGRSVSAIARSHRSERASARR